MARRKPVTRTDRRWEQWVAREAPIVLPEPEPEPEPRPPLRRRTVLSSSGHTPRRATGRLTPVAAPREVTNQRLAAAKRAAQQPPQPWSEGELLDDWASGPDALDFYRGREPRGMSILKAGAVQLTQPQATARYAVLQTAPGHGASLDHFAPEGWMRSAAREELPLAHAEIQRHGRGITVTPHRGVHPGCTGAPTSFEWRTMPEAKSWEAAIRTAGEEAEDEASRAAARRHAAQAAEEEELRRRAALRLEEEREAIRARQQEAEEAAAAAAADETLGATAAAAEQLVAKHRARARLEVPTVHAIADGRHPSVDDLGKEGSHADEARSAIAELRAEYHLREPKPPTHPRGAAPRVNEDARRKRAAAAGRRDERARAQRREHQKVLRRAAEDSASNATVRQRQYGQCALGDACKRPGCRFAHPRDSKHGKGAITERRLAHEQRRSDVWKSQHTHRRDLALQLKLGLRNTPMLAPDAAVDPEEARRALAELHAKYHPRRGLRPFRPAPDAAQRVRIEHAAADS